jgi:hypothetical protein
VRQERSTHAQHILLAPCQTVSTNAQCAVRQNIQFAEYIFASHAMPPQPFCEERAVVFQVYHRNMIKQLR